MTNNDLSLEEIKELSNLIGQNEDNIQSTKVLLDNFIHIKWHTIHDFWQELILEFINRDFKIQYQVENEEIDNLVVSIRPRACFFPLFSFLPLWLHYNLNPLCVQY